jgi:pilus assembly protein CpaB
MKTARLVVLGVALAAGVGAAWMVGGQKEPPPPLAQAPAPIATDDVLVAAKDMGFGTLLADGDARWQPWPKNNIPVGIIRRSEAPAGLAEVKGSILRVNVSAGEPLRRERLAKAGAGGFLSAVLTPGMRAVAINIEPQGQNTAGGFILPNDHVDIIRTYRDEDAVKSGAADAFVSETILTNIRVLAIGQNVQEKNNQSVVVGSTATLETTQRQAEIITLAQRSGQLSLVLRSMADAGEQGIQSPQPQSLMIVRYGVPAQAGIR